ncbi:GPI anchored serine-threonine rich family protein [Aspergillus neoniger CBS 115656]|uniref:Yeast cell wall synthesis Kre9/Knh1-like N-terminal domain-containing protein n=2 Tax=Aspergillus subgen. Circumdati TaxID=2720871 RepID=A0A318YNR9_ASPNB|nr:hypothetical protein BO87DRAFT_426150 [Aspergillus neoniger CBS 115656]XP_025536218.1 hypothetical protein BO79DRAFT_258384 [Aspergillus costaricaensis CBS 115574]PYH34383.1 hypothetical protein BO87DRAFT_426150 [Aspergillus neoniger CBS 115656]RAK85383.1 hypothetical protein BO79DRAFT_258384 [Aspergillus costaricaensis CBS 115574]
MHFLNIVVSMMAFAVTALAITITQPKNGDQVDFSKPYTIKWTTVASDPTNFDLILVNMNSQPTVSKKIANVKTSDSKYTVDKVIGIPVAEGYQLNAESNTTQNTGILSQSQQFNVTKVGKAETSKENSILSSSLSSPSQPSSSSPSSSPSPCIRPHTSTIITKTTSRPCINHQTTSPSSTAPSASTTPASATTSATQTAAASTSSSAGSAAYTGTLPGSAAVIGALAMGVIAEIL